MNSPALSVVIPAFNEAAYLPRYLPSVLASLTRWEEITGRTGEVIVVDNASTDATADMASSFGVRVVTESVRNIGRVRNTGAAAARSSRLFFTDADVALPLEAVTAAAAAMDAGAVGGAIPPLYTPERLGARLLCAYWDHYRTRRGGAQGVNQFCTADAFHHIGGYRDDLFMRRTWSSSPGSPPTARSPDGPWRSSTNCACARRPAATTSGRACGCSGGRTP